METQPNRIDKDIVINQDFWFPGRWVGGVSLVLAPVLFLAGMLLRVQFHFFFPQQLQAFHDHPKLIITAYNFFIVGNILLWPAIITLARMIGRERSQLALWGGTLVILGLFARTFQGGVNHLAFQLVNIQGLEQATNTVAESYGAFNIISTLNSAIMLGWFFLGMGAYLSGTLGIIRSISLGLMVALMSGVLKGTSIFSLISGTGLVVALVPLGIQVLKEGDMPPLKSLIGWTFLVVATVVVFYFIGQAG